MSVSNQTFTSKRWR